MKEVPEKTFARIWQLVDKIPRGKVATYGQIAMLVGLPRGARTVGWAMHSLPDDRHTPWHRVVGAKGLITLPDHQGKAVQIMLLQQEGVVINDRGQVDMDMYQWIPRGALG